MIRVGTKVKTGDILIGKITPKGESDPTPEEKLLRAIFGEKAGDVKDASLKAKPSHQGVVISKSLFSKSIKTKKDRDNDKDKLNEIENNFKVTKEKLKSLLVSKLYGVIGGKAAKGVNNILGEVVIEKSVKFSKKILMDINYLIVDPDKWTIKEDNNNLIKLLIQKLC